MGACELRRGWDVPSPRSDRLVPVTVPLTTQPTAAHAAASALAVHWYTQEASVEEVAPYPNLVQVWLWLDAQGGADVVKPYVQTNTTPTKSCTVQHHRLPRAHFQANAHTHYML